MRYKDIIKLLPVPDNFGSTEMIDHITGEAKGGISILRFNAPRVISDEADNPE